MTDFNLPPGCSESDIPGNRPEDVAYEEFLENYCPTDPTKNCYECEYDSVRGCRHPQHPDNLAQRSKYDTDERV